jgi:predicted AlkP superfamily pyrophosphatase or phosphodiesterase
MRIRLFTGALAVLVLAAGSNAAWQGAPAASRTAPRIVVLLSLDQMRSDYIERYRHQWTGGLRRLVDGGARFRIAAYPYLNTVTCPGHATIGTGTFPRTHGLILNAWWDRDAAASVDCLTDPGATSLPYNIPDAKTTGFGPANLMAPTLADELRASTINRARVVSVAVKPRSAIGLSGRRGDLVLWVDQGGLTTSTAYASTRDAFVQAYTARETLEAEYGRDWTRLLPADQYLNADDDDAERPPNGWTRTFPHQVAGAPVNRQYSLWSSSPLVDEYLGRFLEAAIAQQQLGKRGVTDFLAMSFSSLDTIGHAFGPDSHEVQDALARIDRVIGRLLDALDRQVGPDGYVIGLSADHGVAPIPEQAMRAGFDAGRVAASDVSKAVDDALAGVLGPGKYVGRVTYTDVYLLPGAYERMRDTPGAWDAVRRALPMVPGIERAYHAADLASPAATDDPVLRAARLSYYPPRSGDIVIVPRPYFILSSGATTHGTLYGYDSQVPVVLYGAGIRAGEYWSEATPADLAPTLAALAGVTMSRAEGRVLSEALAR